MPAQMLLLLMFSAPPIAGQTDQPSLPEAIKLFQLEIMNKLRKTVQDQENVISEQQSKIAKLEGENTKMDETINFITESCQAEKTHLKEEFDFEILTRMGRCEEERTEVENDHSQELERMRIKLQQCESTVQYMGELMVQSNQGTSESQNLTEAELGNIKEAEEEINRRWNGSLIDLDIKKLYIDVMNDMKNKFQTGDMNQDQKVAATGVIVATQSLLGQKSFEVLGLQIGEMNFVQIFEVLKGWKEAGNMTT